MKFPDVRTGNKSCTRADQHHGFHRRILGRRLHGIEDALGNPGTERIHGRIVDGDNRNVSQTRQLCKFVHRFSAMIFVYIEDSKRPPSTTRIWPVMKEDWSLASNNATSATSIGWPK